MFPRDEKVEELLGSFLDGEVSPSEATEVERLLESSSEARCYLDDLKRMRASLSRLPLCRLDSNFSSRVLEGARSRAADLGGAAPDWIQPAVISPPIENSKQSHRNFWIALAALAASLAMIPYFVPKESPLGLLDQSVAKSSSKVEESKVSPLESGLESSEEAKDLRADLIGLPQSSAVPRIASDSTKNESMEGLAVVPDRAPANSMNSEKIVPRAIDGSPKTVIEKPAPSKDGLVAADLPNKAVTSDGLSQAEMLQALERSIRDGHSLRFLMVVDLGVRSDAWDEGLLGQILERHDIAFDSPVQVTDDMRKDLIQSRMIAGAGAPEAGDSKVALVFVKASAERLDRVISEALERIEEFPTFSIDFAMDLPVQQAVKNLESIQEFSELQIQPNGLQGLARPLILPNRNAKEIAQFAGVQPRTRPVVADVRKAGKRVQNPLMNPVSYCLFVLRPQL